MTMLTIKDKFDPTRIPDITFDMFENDQEYTMWFSYLYDKLMVQNKHISIAELRQKAGLDVTNTDYLYGFDYHCLDYTGNATRSARAMSFLPIHVIRIVKPNTDIVDYTKLISDILAKHDKIES